jgi:predicted GNAT family N-acyltransferase
MLITVTENGARFNEAITGIASHYGESKITIGAQLYLKKFYESRLLTN